MFPIPPEATFIVVRFLLAWGSGILVAHGFAPAPPDQVVTAAAQIVVGLVGLASVTAYGVWRRRRSAKIAEVAGMVGVNAIHADHALAAAMQARGVLNVVATAPQAGG